MRWAKKSNRTNASWRMCSLNVTASYQIAKARLVFSRQLVHASDCGVENYNRLTDDVARRRIHHAQCGLEVTGQSIETTANIVQSAERQSYDLVGQFLREVQCLKIVRQKK